MIGSLKLSADDKARLISLVSGEKDYLADIPLQDKEHYLHSTSYASFMYERVGMSRSGARLIEPWPRAMFGVGIESTSVWEAIALGAPGLNALGLPEGKAAVES